MTYVVGVDSGGTHTNIRVIAPDGTSQRGAELNRSLTSNRTNAELREIFGEILAEIRIRTMMQPVSIWVSSAGYSASTRVRFEELLNSCLDDTITGPIGMSNDAVTLLLGHDEETVVVIAGTGSVAMARSPDGEVVTRGGDEWVVADYGSAFWMGLDGLRATYTAIEGGPDTDLRHSVIEHFRPLEDTGEEMPERAAMRQIARSLASLGTSTKPTIASFAKEVTR
jgi:N-acetylglucosamine kinase-like BadF-type ATPase